MTTTLPTVLISGASEELTARIVQLIRSQAELLLVKNLSPAEATGETFTAKLIWVELESDPANNILLLEQLIKSHPNTFFVVSKEDLEPELVKKAMQVGALDFLDHKGWAAQIRSVIRRIMAKEFGTKPAGGPAAAIPRQPTRASSWGQLNSINKPTPAASSFRRVEPNRQIPGVSSSATPTPQAPTPAPAAPEVVHEPELVEEPQVQAYADEDAQQYSQEETVADGQDWQNETAGYAEQGAEEGQYAEQEYDPEAYTAEQEYAQEGQEAYSEQGYTEGSAEQGYTEQEYSEQQYAEQGYSEQEYSEQQYAEQGYSEQEYSEQQYAEQGYSEQEYAEQESAQPEYAGEDSAEQGYTEQEHAAEAYEQQEAYAHEDAAQTEPEPPPATPEATFSADENTLKKLIRQEPTQTRTAPTSTRSGMATLKGSWDELDSIISKEQSLTKEVEKKAPQWGDLDKIAKNKEEPAAPAPEPVSASPNKWGDLDKIAAPTAEETAKAPESKWGDLINLAAPKALKKDEESPNAESSKVPNKWGDLDALGTKKAGETASNWGDLDAIAAPAKDSGFKSNTQSVLKSKIQALPATTSQYSDLDGNIGTNTRSQYSDLDGNIGTNTRAQFGDPDTDIGTAGGDNKWGDLENLGKGDSNRAALEASNYGEEAAPKASLEPLKGTSASAFKNRFGKKTQNIDTTEIPQESSLQPEPAKKWGDLESIPTPKEAAGNWGNLNAIPTPGKKEAGANWGNLDSIPTPKAEGGPTLIEGALPSAQVVSEQSQRWKAGMSSDLSTGAREFGEMRDKIIKGTKVSVPKVGWNNFSWLVAASILISFGYLFTQFLVFPEPAADEQHQE